MQITLNVVGDESELKPILAALAGQPVMVDSSEAARPAPKAETAAKPAPAAKTKKAEPAAEEPPPAAVDDADEDSKMETAVERATKLINAGDADKLRSILSEIGVKRVSELAGGDLDTFLSETA